VACCFPALKSIRNVLEKLREADLGISIVAGGLIDELVETAKSLDLKPHTAFLSLGIHGKKAALPEDRVLEITTMCGHGMVPTNLTQTVIEKVKSKEMTPEEGADFLAQPCPCGIFNTTRCEALLKNVVKNKHLP
jgi:hypothetical protein